MTNGGVMGLAGGAIVVIAVVIGTVTYITIRRMDAEYARASAMHGKAMPL